MRQCTQRAHVKSHAEPYRSLCSTVLSYSNLDWLTVTMSKRESSPQSPLRLTSTALSKLSPVELIEALSVSCGCKALSNKSLLVQLPPFQFLREPFSRLPSLQRLFLSSHFSSPNPKQTNSSLFHLSTLNDSGSKCAYILSFRILQVKYWVGLLFAFPTTRWAGTGWALYKH